MKNWDGCELKLFTTEKDCLQSLNEKPDVVIIDLLKIIDCDKKGTNTLAQLKKMDQSLSVIVISDKFDEKEIKKYYNEGAVKCISMKGYFVDKLKETLDLIKN
ncbi:MAG TPA: response regulator [Bacteroidales bacterium]|nr:response regulator [Bacteroidales bacterium]